MTCEELQNAISAYVDDELTTNARAACDEHFASCPVCRVELAETKMMARNLASLSRPAPPATLARQISDRLNTERVVLAQSAPRVPAQTLTLRHVLRWFAPRAMPASVGMVASVLLFVTVIGALVPTMRTLHVLERTSLIEFGMTAADDALAHSTANGYDVTQPITTADYVASRSPYTSISPSIDPHGALATSAARLSATASGDDDMLVVADVYSDGQASLAEVVNAPRDSRMLDDLQAALRSTPAFVPSRLDNRPPTMRVVFMVQRLDVRATTY